MKYKVVFENFAETHFIKKFARKYKGAWDKTRAGLFLEFTFVDLLFEKSIAEKISVSYDKEISICKTEFKIAGTEVSRHASGNRCIIAINHSTSTVYVLLVYAKTDIGGESNETTKWQMLIRNNFTEYKKFF